MPKLVMADGNVEAIKWLALLLMTIDHINRFLFNQQFLIMYEIGRIAMPLFGFVLAYNLARPNALQEDMHLKVMSRLFIVGLLASLFYIPLAGFPPLNILFTLLLSTCAIYLVEKGGAMNCWICLLIVLTGGLFVEYAWFAPAYCLAAWWYCKLPDPQRGLVWLGATALLVAVNQNQWALAALPIIFLMPYVKITIPRLRTIFYAYYPVHLALLLLIQSVMPLSP